MNEIVAAFDGVSREGGDSWSQSELLDAQGFTDREYREAGEKDLEKRWQDLLEPSRWKPQLGWGGFTFLDPIGFRYYFAPAAIRGLIDPDFPIDLFDSHLRVDSPDQIANFSMFDAAQSRCVAKLVLLRIEEAIAGVRSEMDFYDAEALWTAHWHKFL